MSGMNIGQILMRGISNAHSTGLEARIGRSAGNILLAYYCHAVSFSVGGPRFSDDIERATLNSNRYLQQIPALWQKDAGRDQFREWPAAAQQLLNTPLFPRGVFGVIVVQLQEEPA